MRHRTIAAVLGLLAVSAGCAPATDGAMTAELAEIRKSVDGLEARLDGMEKANQQAERRRVGMVKDMERLSELARSGRGGAAEPNAAADGDDPAAAASGDAPASATSTAFTKFLETEEGTTALAAAMRVYTDKRDAERRKRVVSALVKPFAEKAYLSQDQAERMSETLETASQNIRDAWTSMRDVPPEQRGAQVQKNIARTNEIRKETDEKIASLLNQAQFEMYEEERAKLLGVPGGGGPPRSGGTRNGGTGNDQ